MILLAGLTAVTVGASLQVSMPTFASDLGTGSSGLAYGVLLFANGVGGVVGGFLLEATGILKPTIRSAVISTLLFAIAVLVFSLTHLYAVAVIALLIAGVAALASMSVSQSIVQLEAPAGERGRIYGVYGMFGSGLRAGGGITLGLLGASLGIPIAVAWCSVALGLGTLVIGVYSRLGARRRAAS
jgi:MFS family permease